MRLDGVRVLDLSRLGPGPFGTQLLRYMGAEVVRVENPAGGDPLRRRTAPEGVGTLFEGVNRGKKSVTLDLKSETGREVFYRMVADADVVFEQFRPGVVDRLGVGYEDVLAHNPEIVYCSLSGFGQTGPYRDRVGHDLNYVGLTGFLDLNRADEDETPRVPGFLVADWAGGLFAAFSIVGSLLSRELGGGGDYVDVSMSDVVLSFSQDVAPEALAGDPLRPGETRLPSRGVPWYDVYETADGGYVTIAAVEWKFWGAFCSAIDREDLVERRKSVAGSSDPDEVARGLDAIEEELEEVFATRTRQEWEATLDGVDAAVHAVNTLEEAFEHPQFRERELVRHGDEGPPRLGFPAMVEGGLPDVESSIPGHGEHTEEVLRSNGFSAADVAALRDDDVI